ncbi:MAG: LpxL/LpxP family Kdo(2)-lipid IV(A) lauroyl/palmitoleoyl acyltransferase [Venatoribacter sp.]
MQKPPFKASYLHPKFWPLWLVWSLIWSIAQLPYKWQLALGKGLGLLLYKGLKSRRRVAEVNIALCFPELSAQEQQQLVRKTFIDNATGFFETMIGWYRPANYLVDRTEYHGFEHIEAAKQQGKGVLFLGAHYSMLDLAGTLFCQKEPVIITYKRQHNPVLNYIMEAGRARTYKHMYPSKEIRQVIRALQEGESVWYAPDQDFGFKNTVFADFFGVPAASLTMTTHLAAAGNAVVLPITYFRKEDNSGYEIRVFPPLDIPGTNEQADALLVNQFIEQQIRTHPSQYLWLHKRFKSQPGEENQRGRLYKKAK